MTYESSEVVLRSVVVTSKPYHKINSVVLGAALRAAFGEDEMSDSEDHRIIVLLSAPADSS